MTDAPLTPEDLKTAPPEVVNRLLKEGKLNHLLNAPTGAEPVEGQKFISWLHTATPQQIADALRAGELQDLLTAADG